MLDNVPYSDEITTESEPCSHPADALAYVGNLFRPGTMDLVCQQCHATMTENVEPMENAG